MIRERERAVTSGLLMLIVLPVAFLSALAVVAYGIVTKAPTVIVPALIALPIIGLLARGLFTVAPNEPLVLQIFGAYAGTVRTPGLRWANPFYTKRKVSVRVRNFESA
jgi:regulator of protease activity HflC (stomatin/prohibitin superfamily)